jgi:hypothetical protein
MITDVQARVEKLNKGLKSFSPKLGYSEVRDRGRLVKYTVHTQVLGDRDILVQPGRETVAKEKLLHELENLARYFKLPVSVPDQPKLPVWLVAEAWTFCDHPQTGLHRFGKQITIRGTGAGGRLEEYITKEQLVYVSATSLEVFRYFPTERARFKDNLHYNAATGWNLSMYHYIEKQGLPPSRARDSLVALQRELIEKIVRELALPDWTDSANVGGDVFSQILGLIGRR